MANPDPEITYELATATRPDVIMATGRSDYPNQVNNVLGFPFIFRGALDVRAQHDQRRDEDRRRAGAGRARARGRARVGAEGLRARRSFASGADYLIPKPFDPRVLLWVAPAVAKAAMDSGVARKPIADIEAYRESLERIMGPSREVMHLVDAQGAGQSRAASCIPEGEHELILRAARAVADQNIARPVLLGRPDGHPREGRRARHRPPRLRRRGHRTIRRSADAVRGAPLPRCASARA